MNKMRMGRGRTGKPLFRMEKCIATGSEDPSRDDWNVFSDSGFLIKGPLTEEEAKKLLAALDALHARQEDYRLGLAPHHDGAQDDSSELWVVFLGDILISEPMSLDEAGSCLIAALHWQEFGHRPS